MGELVAPAACSVRPAEAKDLAAIAAIYNDAILNSVATFDTEPWTPEAMPRWLEEHAAPYAALVAEREGEVLGWASLGPFRSKPAYRYTTENSVYVREDAQGNGVGGLLMARLVEAADANGWHVVIARITTPNEASERLHARYGFERVGVEREVGRKFERWLDVLVMQRVFEGG
jgi:phosphinothricin acetyltransferase